MAAAGKAVTAASTVGAGAGINAGLQRVPGSAHFVPITDDHEDDRPTHAEAPAGEAVPRARNGD